jgi:hypothetical protein
MALSKNNLKFNSLRAQYDFNINSKAGLGFVLQDTQASISGIGKHWVISFIHKLLAATYYALLQLGANRFIHSNSPSLEIVTFRFIWDNVKCRFNMHQPGTQQVKTLAYCLH